MVTVCTFVPPAERSRLEAAGSGCFAAVHADSARELFAAARRYRVDALVISVHRCRSDELPAVAPRSAPLCCPAGGPARHMRARPSTMMSRFYRAGLPSPKSYLAAMRLLHAAYLFQNPGLSVADIAYRLDFSSPQSFSRHLKTLLGVTASEFRHRFPFDVALARFCDLLITPYREALRAFHPLNAGMWDQGPTAAAAAFRAG